MFKVYTTDKMSFLAMPIATYEYLYEISTYFIDRPRDADYGLHTQSEKVSKHRHYFTMLKHDSMQVCIKANYEWDFQII